jgi:hypothetical protein
MGLDKHIAEKGRFRFLVAQDVRASIGEFLMELAVGGG